MHAAIVGFCGVMCRAGHPQRNELQCRRAQAALNEGWYDGAAAKYQENICPPYSARAFVILLPFLSVACASQPVSIPESGIRALESWGGVPLRGQAHSSGCGDLQKPTALREVFRESRAERHLSRSSSALSPQVRPPARASESRWLSSGSEPSSFSLHGHSIM